MAKLNPATATQKAISAKPIATCAFSEAVNTRFARVGGTPLVQKPSTKPMLPYKLMMPGCANPEFPKMDASRFKRLARLKVTVFSVFKAKFNVKLPRKVLYRRKLLSPFRTRANEKLLPCVKVTVFNELKISCTVIML